MKMFKKNQIIIYIIALMLVTAGYLNYTTNNNGESSLETSMQMEANDDTQLADIGDAKLVNSNDVIPENTSTNQLNENNNTSVNQLNENNDTVVDNNASNETNVINDESTNNESTNDDTNNIIETSSNNTDDYFTKSKLDRDTMYSQMLETYEKVLNSTNTLETQKQTATQEITKINDTKNSIMICENLIKIKGFNNCVIFVNGDSISVIIGASDIKQEQVAQIQNIIAREMKAKIENIHISNK